ncbi:hypothetical protein EIN_021470, partial [Entamoeba invadens IP1]|uniref:hypothetical protein n=1 Tax=Entamoeba invadens IP1 TaxID=370355 RepID=UPI0002C3DA84
MKRKCSMKREIDLLSFLKLYNEELDNNKLSIDEYEANSSYLSCKDINKTIETKIKRVKQLTNEIEEITQTSALLKRQIEEERIRVRILEKKNKTQSGTRTGFTRKKEVVKDQELSTLGQTVMKANDVNNEVFKQIQELREIVTDDELVMNVVDDKAVTTKTVEL